MNPKIRFIVSVVCNYRGVLPQQIKSPQQVRFIAYARQEIMYLAKRIADLSYPQIGDFLNRDHTTIMHGVRAVEKRMNACDEYRKEMDRLEKSAIYIMAEHQPKYKLWAFKSVRSGAAHA